MSAPPHDTTQTRGVLAGAYRGRRAELENLKTHLVYVSRGVDVGVACRQPLHHIADEHSAQSEEELQERPTCATCGRAWDRLQRPTPNARRPPPTARIVRVLEVKDTRDYEEGPDGKFYPIPGSGTPSECARCGRTHYVHATVLLSDETTALVGTGCMNQSEMVVAKQAKSAERLAKQIAKLQAEYTVQMQRYEAYEQARKQVERLPLPAYREDRKYFSWAKKELPVMILGDVEQAMPFVEGRDVSHDNWQRKNVREQLVSTWREARIKDMGVAPAVYPRDTERALERAEKKLEGMIDSTSHATLTKNSNGTTIISSQRYLDEDIVAEKESTKDYQVMVSPEFHYDGRTFRVVLDGHHSLAAAFRAGVPPEYIEATKRDSDNVSLLQQGRTEDFLEAVYNDSDWYDIETGVLVF